MNVCHVTVSDILPKCYLKISLDDKQIVIEQLMLHVTKIMLTTVSVPPLIFHRDFQGQGNIDWDKLLRNGKGIFLG